MAADSVPISVGDENSSAGVEAGWASPHGRVSASVTHGWQRACVDCLRCEVPADLLAEISGGAPGLLSITLATEA